MPHPRGRFCGLIGEKFPHNSPSRPRRGAVEPNIDRCIKAGVIKFWGPHENRTPGLHFYYDFGDPSMNLGDPQCNSMFIKLLEE